MNVANVDLCVELNGLSDWYPEYSWYKSLGGEDGYYIEKTHVPAKNWVAPAYPLGYLLRKLRENMYLGLGISARDNEFEFILQRAEGDIFLEADTLENNACKLAIELWKQGVLSAA